MLVANHGIGVLKIVIIFYMTWPNTGSLIYQCELSIIMMVSFCAITGQHLVSDQDALVILLLQLY